ncbi:6674_t:CDS:2, partial [Acaulospora colombiana]
MCGGDMVATVAVFGRKLFATVLATIGSIFAKTAQALVGVKTGLPSWNSADVATLCTSGEQKNQALSTSPAFWMLIKVPWLSAVPCTTFAQMKRASSLLAIRSETSARITRRTDEVDPGHDIHRDDRTKIRVDFVGVLAGDHICDVPPNFWTTSKKQARAVSARRLFGTAKCPSTIREYLSTTPHTPIPIELTSLSCPSIDHSSLERQLSKHTGSVRKPLHTEQEAATALVLLVEEDPHGSLGARTIKERLSSQGYPVPRTMDPEAVQNRRPGA